MRRIRATLQRPLFSLIVLGALIVWAALVLNTVDLARRATVPPIYPTAQIIRPTSVPTAMPPRVVAPPTPAPLGNTETSTAKSEVIHPKTGRYIAAWLPDSFGSANRESFEANADILDEVSPFWYAPSASGSLRFGKEARDQSLLQLAREKHVLVIPTIHNVVNGENPVPTILNSPRLRQKHIDVIVDEVLTYGYDGIDIDYEALDRSLREEYTQFIVDLADALHAQGKVLTVALHAKDCDFCGLGDYQDWAAIGKVVDRMRIMTYDYHWRGGGPGPVSPLYWVTQVAEYAKTVVDPAKVVIGVPFYGYNWGTDTNEDARGQTWEIINDIIQTYNLNVNLLESNKNGPVLENWITYSTRDSGRRTAWFSTSSGLDAKLRLVQSLDLAGIAIWRLGGEDPQNWEVIRARLLQDPFESQRMLNQVLPEH